jgi:hypothetical protein
MFGTATYGMLVVAVATLVLSFSTIARAERSLSKEELQFARRVQMWIQRKRGWHADKLPMIRFVSDRKLKEMYYGKAPGSDTPPVRALFEIGARTIYLLREWRLDNIRDQGTLVHEVAHYLQVSNQVEVACLAAYNKDAYLLQFEWLREHGIDHPREFLEMDDLSFFIITQCPIY